jgi:hypothetical protein
LTSDLTTDATLVAGSALKFSHLPPTDTVFCSFYDGSSQGINLRLTSTGELAIYLANTLLDTTSGLNISTGTWYYIELKVLCSDTVGAYEVRVDSYTQLSATGLHTQSGTNQYNNRVKLSNPHITYMWVDDYYICDGTGSGVTNDFLGQCRVSARDPRIDYVADFDEIYPATGDHYSHVDDGALADDDTTYVEDATTGHRDLFTYWPATVYTNIIGVAINTTCKITDLESKILKTLISSNGVEVELDSSTIMDTEYATVSTISEIDPNTTGMWDIDAFNDAYIGFEIG